MHCMLLSVCKVSFVLFRRTKEFDKDLDFTFGVHTLCFRSHYIEGIVIDTIQCMNTAPLDRMRKTSYSYATPINNL